MNDSRESSFLVAERDRITAEYQRRAEAGSDTNRYAHWQPAEMLMRSERKRIAATMLHTAGVFPVRGRPCLEIGYGRLGWLGELMSLGLREADLAGLELDTARAAVAQESFPIADLRVGDATALPWSDNHFQLVVVSTVFTSILDDRMRRLVAEEITRVLAPGGALLWYDFAVNNPRNSQVRRVTRTELHALFPRLHGNIRSTTLAPPIARLVAPVSWLAAVFLEAIPLLRTHLIAVFKKPEA
jgi:ubiquinone/menaquinone biosynthesis C-methylase UbiE